MKQMQRDPLSRQKALRAERRADEKSGIQVITIKPLAGSAVGAGGGGFKKGGFRNAFGGGEEAEVVPSSITDVVGPPASKKTDASMEEEGVTDDVESENEDDGDGEERYDPRRPTGCSATCPGR